MTTRGNFNISGSAGNLVSLRSINNTTYYINDAYQAGSSTPNYSYLDIQYCSIVGNYTWNASNSINSGFNAGWNFLVPGSGNMMALFF